jgi:hypothetical protein
VKPAIVHYNNWFVKNILVGYAGITFGRHIFLASTEKQRSLITLRHEYQHYLQYQQIGITKFIWLYLKDFFKFYFIENLSWARAYRSIRFEVDAYKVQNQTEDLPRYLV